MGKLEGKVAIVTGATAGIGEGITRCFLEEGAKVVFCGRRLEKGMDIESSLISEGFDVKFIQADVTKLEDIERLRNSALEAYGKIDILVNNAGILRPFELVNMDIEKHYDEVFDVNLKAYFVTTKLIGAVLKDGGSIINIASIGGLMGNPGLSSYGASKAAVISLTKSAAGEFGARKIRVNAILPGTIFSEMMPRDAAFTKNAMVGTPLDRGGEPREIGTVAVFLASDDASFVSGSQIVVDGGFSA